MMKIGVWFSCGAASAIAAKLTVDNFDWMADVRILNNPVAEEDEDNRRFLNEVSEWIGKPIEIVTHPDYPEARCQEIWDKREFMSGPKGAPCTMILKKQARQIWEQKNVMDWHVLGFTSEERDRHDKFVLTERENVLPMLIDAGITKDDCYQMLVEAGIKPPRLYEMGYPNANCVGCVKATSPTYWNHVRRMHPEVFQARAETSRKYGAKLVRVNGERIQLDELDPQAKGRSMKTVAIDCGSFCEER